MKIPSCSKTYGSRTVLNLPEMELPSHAICAVIGANGSGKSTFAKILAGILAPDKPGPVLEPEITAGYMPQRSYAYRMSVIQNILLGGHDQARAEKLMEALSLTHLRRKRADKLSGGETARMALARLIMKDFDLVILDEPTASMDMETTYQAEKLMVDYCRERGAAMLLVTHDLHQAKRVADHILFLQKGALIESGGKEDLLSSPKREETKQFLRFYGMA